MRIGHPAEAAERAIRDCDSEGSWREYLRALFDFAINVRNVMLRLQLVEDGHWGIIAKARAIRESEIIAQTVTVVLALNIASAGGEAERGGDTCKCFHPAIAQDNPATAAMRQEKFMDPS